MCNYLNIKNFQVLGRKKKQSCRKAAFVQTLSIAFNPAVPVFASVITFVGHILCGNTLNVTQVFSKSSVSFTLQKMQLKDAINW